MENTDALGRINVLMAEFAGASDRAAAIVGAAYLEQSLETILLSFLAIQPSDDKRLFSGSEGPLASLSAKTQMAFRLGLISEWEYRSLNAVRRIRNEFSHHLDAVSFHRTSIADRCKELEVPLRMVAPKIFSPINDGIEVTAPIISKANPMDPRALFQEAVVTLTHCLSLRGIHASASRREIPHSFESATEIAELSILELEKSISVLEAACETRKDLLKKAEELGVPIEDFPDPTPTLARVREQIKTHTFIAKQIRKAHETVDPR